MSYNPNRYSSFDKGPLFGASKGGCGGHYGAGILATGYSSGSQSGLGSGYSSRSSSTSSLPNLTDTSSRYSSNRLSDSSPYLDKYSRSSADRGSPYTPSSYTRSSTSSNCDKSDKDLDYKKLYEEEKAAHDKSKKEVIKIKEDLSDIKQNVESLKDREDPSRKLNSCSERRERRALERKISELEEELKDSIQTCQPLRMKYLEISRDQASNISQETSHAVFWVNSNV